MLEGSMKNQFVLLLQEAAGNIGYALLWSIASGDYLDRTTG